MVKHIHGGYKVKYHPEGPEGPVWEVDYTPPFKRVSMIKGLEERLAVKFPDSKEFESESKKQQYWLSVLCNLTGKKFNLEEQKPLKNLFVKIWISTILLLSRHNLILRLEMMLT